jgi:hypothetical protein
MNWVNSKGTRNNFWDSTQSMAQRLFTDINALRAKHNKWPTSNELWQNEQSTEWSKSHATHKSVTRENFTIMIMVILILYVGTTVFPPTRHRCWRDLDSILYTLSRVRMLFVIIWLFRKINMFLFFNITFPLGYIENVRMPLEILSQTL